MNNLNLTSNKVLEIFCDASIKKFPNQRVFGCAGAIGYCNGTTIGETLRVLPDSTNNESEITAILLAVNLANETIKQYGQVDQIIIYSDSKISVYGLKYWMNKWVELMYQGVLYTPQGDRVKNQEIFIQIYDFLARNNMRIQLLHCKGHVRVTSQDSLTKAADVFYESNGFYPTKELLIRMANYNNIIDNDTREYLNSDKVDLALHKPEGIRMLSYVMPVNWKDYIY